MAVLLTLVISACVCLATWPSARRSSRPLKVQRPSRQSGLSQKEANDAVLVTDEQVVPLTSQVAVKPLAKDNSTLSVPRKQDKQVVRNDWLPETALRPLLVNTGVNAAVRDNRSRLGDTQKHLHKGDKPSEHEENRSVHGDPQKHPHNGDKQSQPEDNRSRLGDLQEHPLHGDKPIQREDNRSQHEDMQNNSHNGDKPSQPEEQQQHQKQKPEQQQQQQKQKQLQTTTQPQQSLQPLPPPALMKGISYGPTPLMKPGNLPNDDFMCSAATQQWGKPGRNDLEVIKALGANSVRLYGNDPSADHSDFLDAALALDLRVLPGISDFPFLQSPGSCKMAHGYDCSTTTFDAYLGNLRRGFLRNRSYHPALAYVITINEPDMKLPDISQPKLFCKAIISAIDGILVAEEEAGVVGPRPNITVTFSFTICGNRCEHLGWKPSLGQMWMLRDAMQHPEKYGYKPRNDLGEVYRTRFTHSFNTGNPSFDIPGLFLEAYEKEFPDTPVFIGEYHCPNQNAQIDVAKMLDIARNSALLQGISFFEYMVRYDVGGHTDFGLFSPTAHRRNIPGSPLQGMSYFGQQYDVPCLVPKDSLPWQLGAAFHGNADKAVQLLKQQQVCS